jgi:hypothetical protein
MKPKQSTVLLHPAFLLSVLLLLLNDFYLKYTYHNWFTGKLSDFAGVFAFAVFLSAIFYKQKKAAIIIVTSLFFLWWKSPLSSSYISFFNSQLYIPIDRVIDYTDYIALTILAFIYYLKPINYYHSLQRQLMLYTSCIVSLFAFSATSLPHYLTDDNKIKVEKYIDTKKTEQQIIEAFSKNNLNPHSDTAFYEKQWSRNYYTPIKTKNGELKMQPVDSIIAGVYQKVGYGSPYTIPKMYVGNDSIFNIQLLISEPYNKKKRIVEVYTFESHNRNDTSGYYSDYSLLRRIKKPLIKKIKSIIKD